jgi:hypothetical protein
MNTPVHPQFLSRRSCYRRMGQSQLLIFEEPSWFMMSFQKQESFKPTYAEYTSWFIARPRVENVEISRDRE